MGRKPYNFCLIHIDNSSDPHALSRFDIDVFLAVLDTNTAIIAVVADTIGLLKTELSLFVFLGDQAQYEVVVFN